MQTTPPWSEPIPWISPPCSVDDSGELALTFWVWFVIVLFWTTRSAVELPEELVGPEARYGIISHAQACIPADEGLTDTLKAIVETFSPTKLCTRVESWTLLVFTDVPFPINPLVGSS